jgi:hypothetical protein
MDKFNHSPSNAQKQAKRGKQLFGIGAPTIAHGFFPSSARDFAR